HRLPHRQPHILHGHTRHLGPRLPLFRRRNHHIPPHLRPCPIHHPHLRVHFPHRRRVLHIHILYIHPLTHNHPHPPRDPPKPTPIQNLVFPPVNQPLVMPVKIPPRIRDSHRQLHRFPGPCRRRHIHLNRRIPHHVIPHQLPIDKNLRPLP